MITLLTGDVRSVLPTLADGSVQCVVCSPPYYALRSYLDTAHPDKHREIGSEPTPDAYLATMVAVFREVRRVLRQDGTCWINMGDSYASGVGMARDQPYQRHAPQKSGLWKGTRSEKRDIGNDGVVKDGAGLKPKDLLMMPARLALALQADGWWVRSAIVWSKPNPMPESCTDRPTSAYEMVYLLTRSARYFYDADAVRETAEYGYSSDTASWHDVADAASAGFRLKRTSTPGNGGTRNLRNVWTIATHAYPQAHFATYPPELAERCIRAGTSERGACSQCGKPWVRQTSVSYTEAGNGNNNMKRKGGDYEAAMSSRPYEVRKLKDVETTGWSPGCKCEMRCQRMGCRSSGDAPLLVDGVCPKCETRQETVVPCTVLDPFSGAGTTLLVADRLGRDSIGIDLNHQYVEMAKERLRADCPLFAEFSPLTVGDAAYDRDMLDLFEGDEYQRLPPPLTKPPAFRNGANYINQRGPISNGLPEAAE